MKVIETSEEIAEKVAENIYIVLRDNGEKLPYEAQELLADSYRLVSPTPEKLGEVFTT